MYFLQNFYGDGTLMSVGTAGRCDVKAIPVKSAQPGDHRAFQARSPRYSVDGCAKFIPPSLLIRRTSRTQCTQVWQRLRPQQTKEVKHSSNEQAGWR